MVENTYRKKDDREGVKVKDKTPKGKSIFQLLDSALGFNTILTEGLPVKQVPKILFIMVILIFYIANTHYADKIVRNSAKLKSEVEDLRADYTTLKADLMFKSKQSEVAKRVAYLGLEESLVPPYKIEIEKE